MRWSDLHGDKLIISRAVTRTMRINNGKTANAQRVQFLPDVALKEFEAQRELTASLKSPWVFPNFSGGMLCQDLPALHWRRIRATLGCTDVALYNFRHSYITALAGAGVPLISLKSLVGHSVDMPTLEVYGHTTESSLRAAQTKLNEVFGAL